MTTRHLGVLNRAWRLAAAAIVASLLLPGIARACAVCYGAVDSPMTAGVNNGILVLLVVIAVVQVGFVALFVSLRQRARQVHEEEAENTGH